jgi:hypothetical protein
MNHTKNLAIVGILAAIAASIDSRSNRNAGISTGGKSYHKNIQSIYGYLM